MAFAWPKISHNEEWRNAMTSTTACSLAAFCPYRYIVTLVLALQMRISELEAQHQKGRIEVTPIPPYFSFQIFRSFLSNARSLASAQKINTVAFSSALAHVFTLTCEEDCGNIEVTKVVSDMSLARAQARP